MPEFKFDPQQSDDELARQDLIQDASFTLQHSYNDMAPVEALIRALVHERSERREEARFWTEVYNHCTLPERLLDR